MPASQTLRSGLYLMRGTAQEITYAIYWPQDTTWDDDAISAVARNRVTFMRSVVATSMYLFFMASYILYTNLFSWGAKAVATPASYHHDAGVLRYVNPKIGTYGTTPNGNGGMVPSVSPPFGMTRWTPQTREVSFTSRHDEDA